MKSQKHVIELCTHKQQDCKFFSPVFPVGFEDLDFPESNVRFVHNTNDNYMLFVLSGKITMNYCGFRNMPFQEGDLFFLPRNMEFRGIITEPSHLALLKYNNIKFPCLEEGIHLLLKEKESGNFKWAKIRIREELRRVIDELIHYRKHGLACNHIYVVKSQEIYLIFKYFYSSEERIQIFYPFIGQNPIFAEAVVTNYMLVKTAEELASRLGYGIKTFRKLFKLNFGKTPYQWMQQQLALQIKGKLMRKEIPLKQIMFEYRFSTNSHFISFCRKHFGGTPMEVRNGKTESLSFEK